MSDGWPVSLKVGATGAGIGIGCGLGVGVGRPINLGGVPVLSSMASGVSQGVGSLSSGMGVGGTLGRISAFLSSKGLVGGIGCGVGIGYGFGAGLMVRPAALESLQTSAENLIGAARERVGIPNDSQKEAAGGASTLGFEEGDSSLSSAPPAASLGHVTPDARQTTVAPVTPQRPESPQLDDIQKENEVLRALLRQNRDIGDLKKENEELRKAICKIDPKSEVCNNVK